MSDTITTSDMEGNRIVNITAARGESLTDTESYRWFIEEIARDLRDGLERFVPESTDDGPLYASMQTLLDSDNIWIWDNEYDYNGDVSILMNRGYQFVGGYEFDFFRDTPENDAVCFSCAVKEHGIYLESSAYRDAVGLHAASDSEETCGVSCVWCNETIKEHDDTELKPCEECGQIWTDMPKVHIVIPEFTRRIVSWRLWQGHTIMMMPACGHETFDIQQEEFRSYMSDWYATHRVMNYRYYGLGMPRWVIYCPVCFTEWIKATLTREDQICVECEGPIGWKRAYICKTAGEEPKHDRDYRYVHDEENQGSPRKIEWCVVGDDTGPIYEFIN